MHCVVYNRKQYTSYLQHSTATLKISQSIDGEKPVNAADTINSLTHVTSVHIVETEGQGFHGSVERIQEPKQR